MAGFRTDGKLTDDALESEENIWKEKQDDKENLRSCRALLIRNQEALLHLDNIPILRQIERY